MALDVESGSVHIIDKIIFDILNDSDLSKYSADEVKTAREEIDELKEEGVLFSQCPVDVKQPVFNNPVVKAMCLHIAHDCNLRCKYCFAHTGDYKGQRALMSLEVAKKAIDFLLENSGSRKNLELDFFGGEPLLNFDVVKQTYFYAREKEKEYGKNIRFTMTTNAYCVTQEMADFMNEHMKNVVISIDGRKEVHDEMRPNAGGKGSFDKVVENAKMILAGRGDKEYYVRGTYTAKNLDFSKDVLAISDMGFDQISVEPVVYGGDLEIKEEHLDKIRSEYDKLGKIYLERKKNGKFFNFFHFMVDLNSGPCLNKRLRGCGAGTEYVAVTPSGDIYPCHQFTGEEDFKIGDVFSGIQNKEIGKKFCDCHVFNKEKCSECWAKYYCSGGCAANAYFTNGDIMKPYEIGCETEKKRLEVAIGIKAKEALEK